MCLADVSHHVLSLLGSEGLYRNVVVNGRAPQKFILSKITSDAFTLRLQLKSSCSAYVP